MPDRLATLKDTEGGKPADPIAHANPSPVGTKTMRFTYPSGSQPLDGFTIKRGIGIGGFGEVYFAVSAAGKEVAIKRIQRNLDVELRGVKQCLNLKHVNLIALWDIRANDLGESWVVMEYVPGYSLREKLEQHPQGMPVEEIRQWFLSIAAGVNYLHKNGIVHRDLKPGNIFFDNDQHIVKIGDYGLSKFISCSKRSGQTESVGTFHYMAPEIGKGVYGKEIDIYALGVILFEMLCGDLPFEGESAQEIIMKHLTADPELSRIPQEYRACVRGALVKDPEERFGSVKQMLESLPWGEALSGQSLHSIRVDIGTTERDSNEVTSQFPEPEIVFSNHGESGQEVLYIGDNGIEVIRSQALSVSNRFSHGLISAPVASGGARPKEPIARALHGGMKGVMNWWNRSDVSVPLKVTIAIIASIMLIVNSSWLLVVSLILGFVYLAYYAVFSWLQPADHQVRLEETKAASRERHEKNVRNWLSNRTLEERMGDLTSSLLIATLACIVLSLIGMVIKGTVLNPGQQSWAVYAWLAINATLASWSILITSKTWEHRKGDPWLRRLTMTTCGLLLGGVGYGLANFFFVDFTNTLATENHAIPQLTTTPMVASFLIFFAGWFGLSRMWSLVDPSRSSRMKLWRVGLGLAMSVLLGHFVGISPLMSGLLVVITSISAQIAAPLISFEDLRQTKAIG